MSDSGDSDRFSAVDTLHYSPNQPAAVAAGIVFLGLSVTLFYRLFRHKNWWGLCLPIGTFAFAAGFFIRLASAKDQYSVLKFTFNQILIVVSPAAFLAFNYILYGRVIRTFATRQKGFSWIRPEKVATVFVTSDVVTFLVQGTGGGLQSQDKSANLGRVVLLLGIIIQAISYVFFYVMFIHAHRKFSTDGRFHSNNFPWRLLHVLHFSSVCILIRSGYRSVELIGGSDSYLATHEVYFYALDTIPLFFATAIYAIFWPGAFFEAYGSVDYDSIHLAAVAPYSGTRV